MGALVRQDTHTGQLCFCRPGRPILRVFRFDFLNVRMSRNTCWKNAQRRDACATCKFTLLVDASYAFHKFVLLWVPPTRPDK